MNEGGLCPLTPFTTPPMFIFYDIAVHLAFLLLLPYFLLRAIVHGKYRIGIKERFGFIDPSTFAALAGKKVVWFHAVSVGETKAAVPLLKLFRERHPEAAVVFSTVTPTGNAVAAAEGAGLIDALIYFPIDMGWVVKRVLPLIKPDLFVVVEKELWPGVTKELARRGVPMVVVNGTFSGRSFARYKRLSFFFAPLFGVLATFCGRTDEDAAMACDLGVAADSVFTAGNLKFDMAPVTFDRDALRREFSVGADDLVIVAGSTHDGEERAVLDAYDTLKAEFKGLRLIIAPRHPERFGTVADYMTSRGVSFTRRSTRETGETTAEVVLLDTLGELGRVYSLATVAFVGGTIADIGGHNLLEPALFGRPVVYGPNLGGYLYMAELLEEAGGGVRARADGLADALRPLLSDTLFCDKTGRAARAMVDANRGATERCADVIDKYLKG